MNELVIGIDEVGRGCWAGPLVVGAVILRTNIPGLVDSKTINKNTRTLLDVQIRSNAIICSTGWVWPDEIDDIGLTAATTLAIERALEDVRDYDRIIIDGSINFLPDNPKSETIIKADATVPAVSAASVVAKVARDQYMIDQSELFPDYGFERHVGYGTAYHRQAIIDLGITPLHRRSYKPIQQIIDGFAVV